MKLYIHKEERMELYIDKEEGMKLYINKEEGMKLYINKKEGMKFIKMPHQLNFASFTCYHQLIDKSVGSRFIYLNSRYLLNSCFYLYQS